MNVPLDSHVRNRMPRLASGPVPMMRARIPRRWPPGTAAAAAASPALAAPAPDARATNGRTRRSCPAAARMSKSMYDSGCSATKAVAGFLTEQIGPALISMGLAFLAVAGGTAFLSMSSPSSHPSPVVTRWARGKAAVSGTSEPPCQQGEKWWSNSEGRRGQSLRPLGGRGPWRHLSPPWHPTPDDRIPQ